MPVAKSKKVELVKPTVAELRQIIPVAFGLKYNLIADTPEEKKKDVIVREIGDLSNWPIMSGRVLVAIYIAPRKFFGSSIERTDANVKEDLWQGQVGLVLKKGPLAFQDDDVTKFHGQDIQIGDWIFFRPGDASKRIQIRGVDCRIVEDTVIDGVTPEPWAVTHFS